MRHFDAKMTFGGLSGTIYDCEDILRAWISQGQGHQQAIERGPDCVVIKCEKNLAIKLARLFCEEFFNIPTCTHYNSDTLSCYCGDAGGGTERLMERFKKHLTDAQYLGVRP